MNNQSFFYFKNNFVKYMSKEKNMTVEEYNDKYITLIGECCALDKIGFISIEKNKIPNQICNYIEFLEQYAIKRQEKINKSLKYIKETTQKNDELGCTKLLSVKQVEMLLKMLEEVSE